MFPKYDTSRNQYCVDLEFILNSIPPKFMCDQYVMMYTSYFEPLYQILHLPTFSRQYDHFWNTPESWTETLSRAEFAAQIAVLAVIGAQLQSQTPVDTDEMLQSSFEPLKIVSVLSAWVVQLKCGKKGQIEIIQIQCLLILAQKMLSYSATELWRSAGDLVRSAIIHNLHEDPAQHDPRMPLVQAEVRRKLWFTIAALDLELSTACCMPSLIQTVKYSTRTPSFDDLLEGAGNSSDRAKFPYHIVVAKSLPIRLKALEVLNQRSPTLSDIRNAIANLEDQQISQAQVLMPIEDCHLATDLFHVIAIDMMFRKPILLLRTLELQSVPKSNIVNFRTSISHAVAQYMVVMERLEMLDPQTSDHEAVSNLNCWNAFQAFYNEDIIRAAFGACFCVNLTSSSMSNSKNLRGSDFAREATLDLPRSAIRRMIEVVVKSFVLNKPDLRVVLKQLMGLSIVSELTKNTKTDSGRYKLMQLALERILHLCNERYALRGAQSTMGRRQDSTASSNSFDLGFMDQDFHAASFTQFDWNMDVFSEHSLQPSVGLPNDSTP
jgi:hypothetical protein